jgi:hypothetical protein
MDEAKKLKAAIVEERKAGLALAEALGAYGRRVTALVDAGLEAEDCGARLAVDCDRLADESMTLGLALASACKLLAAHAGAPDGEAAATPVRYRAEVALGWWATLAPEVRPPKSLEGPEIVHDDDPVPVMAARGGDET